MKNWLFQRVCAFVLSLSILSLGSPAVSYAGLIDTARSSMSISVRPI